MTTKTEKPKTEALFNANDGLTGRDGGPYLDEVEAQQAEIRRAKVEGREPDLDNPPASAGIVLVTARQAFANGSVNNVPSQDGTDVGDTALRAVADDSTNGLRIYSEREVVTEDEPVAETPADYLDPDNELKSDPESESK